MRWAWIWLIFVGVLWGQKPPAPLGVVRGHVTYADTRQPARLVEVTLLRRPDGPVPEHQTFSIDSKDPPQMVSIGARSQLDGSFTILDVPPGTYFAIVKAPGYIVPVGTVKSNQDGRDFDTVMRQVPQVRVQEGQASDVNLELHRGGSITGRLLFEDGGPVPAMFVQLLPVDGNDFYFSIRPNYLLQGLGYGRDQAQTDDEGRFRIIGVRPGKYVIETTIPTAGGNRMVSQGEFARYASTGSSNVRISVYQPDAFHKAQAKVYEIKAAERVDGADFTLRLSGLHTIRGRVLAGEDRHPPTQCVLFLEDGADKDFQRSAYLAPDGTFAMPNVPSGTYTLVINAARDADTSDLKVTRILKTFNGLKQPVIVLDRDLDLDDLVLTEHKEK